MLLIADDDCLGFYKITHIILMSLQLLQPAPFLLVIGYNHLWTKKIYLERIGTYGTVNIFLLLSLSFPFRCCFLKRTLAGSFPSTQLLVKTQLQSRKTVVMAQRLVFLRVLLFAWDYGGERCYSRKHLYLGIENMKQYCHPQPFLASLSFVHT